jgi:membrane dipeptidase
MLIVDAHEDLAWNILNFGRDYSLPAAETRRRETGSQAPEVNGDTLLGWEDYQRGEVAVVFATLFAAPKRRRLGEWDTQAYADPDQAHAVYRAQMEAYLRLVDEHPDRFRLLLTRGHLEEVLSGWTQRQAKPEDESREGEGVTPIITGPPVGLMVLMEGAEGVRTPEELEGWWQRGVRLIGPAWAGTRFCGGTREPGPLTSDGYALLEAMADFGFALDLSHMDEQAALQALDAYPGTVCATHANAIALLKGVETNRHLTDRLIQGIVERDGVVGVVPCNRFLVPGWRRKDGREGVSLRHVVAHIDYICQMAGDAQHAGLGSDFDGGFGLQSTPAEIDTIADLQKLAPLLAEEGYIESDIAAILGMNWIARLRRILPEAV